MGVCQLCALNACCNFRESSISICRHIINEREKPAVILLQGYDIAKALEQNKINGFFKISNYY